MSWNGIGITLASAAPPGGAASPLALLEPSSAWTGTAGSGFAVAPTDPARTTAKPAVRLLTPPFQRFTQTLDVGVVAFANAEGNLIGGIDRVRFHFEGSSVDVIAPHFHDITDARGERSSYLGYWVKLKRPEGTSGAGRLYVEAIPADATMQPRVIGPFVFSPMNSRYERELTVAPSLPEIAGARYQTLNAAVQYTRAQGDHNPLITIAEEGTYSIADASSPAYDRNGYCNITASVPGVSIGYPDDSNSVMECARMKLHLFGPNLTLDFANFAILQGDFTDIGLDHWLDGITVTNSNGRDSFFRGLTHPGGLRVRGRPWFTECVVTNLGDSLRNATVRGCTVSSTFDDLVNGSTVIQSTFNDHTTGFFNRNDPAFEVQYTGTAAVATIARRGSVLGTANADGIGMYRVRIGATNYDFVVGDGSTSYWNGSAGDGFWFQDVVDWLNTLPDVTATRLVPLDRAACTGSLGPADNSNTQFGTKGQGWGFPANATTAAISIKTKRTITSYFDLHGDWYQHGQATLENVIVWGNRVWNCAGQLLFLSPTGSAPVQRDVFVVGNGFHRPDSPLSGASDGQGNASQWGRPGSGSLTVSHVVLAHNSWTGQRLLLRGGAGNVIDRYSMLKNCAMPSITIDALGWANKTIDGVHLRAGSVVPSIGSNYTLGGDSSFSFYADPEMGDFRPRGPLLSNLSAPVLDFDLVKGRFTQPAPKGAISAQ